MFSYLEIFFFPASYMARQMTMSHKDNTHSLQTNPDRSWDGTTGVKKYTQYDLLYVTLIMSKGRQS